MMENAADILARMQKRWEDEDRLPKCPKCQSPMRTGECGPCRERQDQERDEARRRLEWDIKRLGGIKAVERFTLETYDNKAAIAKCAGYPKENLYIWGAAGVGKSHLAVGLVRRFDGGMVVRPQQILRQLRGLTSGEAEEAVLRGFAAKPYLVIDDLGVEKNTAFALSALYELIEMRDMGLMRGLIVTSNLGLSSLADKLGDDRITSRLAGMCRVVNLNGEDRRIDGI